MISGNDPTGGDVRLKPGDVVTRHDCVGGKQKFEVVDVDDQTAALELRRYREPWILRPAPMSSEVAVEQPKRRPEIVTRPGQWTRWRR